MNLQVSESITFEEAIDFTHSLLEKMEAHQLSESDIQTAIASLVKTVNGARGFFVTYLTDSRPIVDKPSQSTIEALKTSPEIVSELLAKNLAMSSAMAITHRRNHNEELAQGSEQVHQRTAYLIEQLQSNLLTEKLKQLQASAATGEGNYHSFLKRWGYDEEQKQVIQKAISAVIK
jgi:hypothetical protein